MGFFMRQKVGKIYIKWYKNVDLLCKFLYNDKAMSVFERK